MSGARAHLAPRRTRRAGLTVLLPADWWTVDLAHEGVRRRQLAALVTERLGGADVDARLRADLRRTLEGAASRAATAGGELLAVSLMSVGGRPVPADLTLYRVPAVRLDAAGAEALASLLVDESDGGADVATADGVDGPVVRHARIVRGPAALGGEALEMLVVDYWRTVGGTTVLGTFSSPLVALAPVLLDLFDGIVASLREAEEGDDGAEGGVVPGLLDTGHARLEPHGHASA